MCNSKKYNRQFDLKTLLSIGYSSSYNWIQCIGVAPITHICDKKNTNIQWRSPYVPSDFHAIRSCSQRKGFSPSGNKFFPLKSKFLPLREVPIMKRDAIEENHCLSPFDVRNFFAVLYTGSEV